MGRSHASTSSAMAVAVSPTPMTAARLFAPKRSLSQPATITDRRRRGKHRAGTGRIAGVVAKSRAGTRGPVVEGLAHDSAAKRQQAHQQESATAEQRQYQRRHAGRPTAAYRIRLRVGDGFGVAQAGAGLAQPDEIGNQEESGDRAARLEQARQP